MKKLLVLTLVLAMATVANATVVQVATDGVGSISGNTGLDAGSKLVLGDQIKLKITLTDLDNYASPAYDGYVLSTLAVKLNADSVAELFSYTTLAAKPKTYVAGVFSAEAITGGASSQAISIGSTDNDFEGYTAGQGTTLVYNLWLEITAEAQLTTFIDMVLDAGGGSSTYKTLLAAAGGPTTYETMVNADLGGLTLYTVPEPITIALLGIGGLFLRRRK